MRLVLKTDSGIGWIMAVSVSKKSRRKEYEVSKEGRVTVYPTLHETKEKGTLKRILKKLIHIRKGHWGYRLLFHFNKFIVADARRPISEMV